MTDKIKLATIWLDGCSGCHMSFIDLDEHLLELSDSVEVVFSPLVDTKHFPENVDVTLVEGAISTDEDLKKLKNIRKNSKMVIAFGDCAITANVPGMRNPLGAKEMMEAIYLDETLTNPQVPKSEMPVLFEKSKPLHHYVPIDLYLPGCPPSADTIYKAVVELLAGNTPDVNKYTRFGA